MGLAEIGYETIMVNCNPETVSTDYDTADRLYFEPLTREDVVEVLLKEQERGELVGAVVQFGGQTPLSLAKAIEEAGIPVLGTSPDTIDLCEDRERCRELVDRLGLRQPPNRVAGSAREAADAADEIGYPVVIRPSYVLGGRAMRIVGNETELGDYIASAVRVSNERPVLIEGYLRDAIECDVDAVSDGENVRIAGVLEHVEPAGVHSGDSACVFPPYSLDKRVVAEIERQTVLLARTLGVVGLMNVQFAVQRGVVHLIEINPRASRTVPFVAKARGIAYARDAAKIVAGVPMDALGTLPPKNGECVAAKVSVLPFKRFGCSDPLLGPEMKSTGEVMGFGRETAHAFARAQEAAGFDLGRDGAALVLSLPELRDEANVE
jgi:carbamoyl-phosphate synthase large subunit